MALDSVKNMVHACREGGRMAMAVWLALAPLSSAPAEEVNQSEKVTYYVQLVRGSNDSKPPTPSTLSIGPKLSAHLRPVFAWKNYWEIAQNQVELAAGQKAFVRLSDERKVEIDLTTKGKRIVTAFSKGELVSRTTHPIGRNMTVIGGDRDKETAWFIIVRLEKPSH